MLKSLLATSGYAAELPALKGRRFEFPEGLVVLFGQNASGKSTLLNLLAGYSGCAQQGWTTFAPEYIPPYKKGPATFPKAFRTKGCEAEVEWDGTATYYTCGPTSTRSQVDFAEALETGGDEADDFLKRILVKVSSGQDQIGWLNNLEKRLATVPNLHTCNTWRVSGHGEMSADKVNDTWGDVIRAFEVYLQSLPATGPLSVLLDEPDVHMSIPNQHILWSRAMPRVAVGRQLIVATHSPFALTVPGATIIDMTPGYADACREVLKTLTPVPVQ